MKCEMEKVCYSLVCNYKYLFISMFTKETKIEFIRLLYTKAAKASNLFPAKYSQRSTFAIYNIDKIFHWKHCVNVVSKMEETRLDILCFGEETAKADTMHWVVLLENEEHV